MVVIREGRAGDAPSIAGMINAFNGEEGSPGRVDVADVTKLCFAPTSTYRAMVAEDGDTLVGDTLVGYALLLSCFDTDPCAWCTYMQDLFVVSAKRSQGVGRRLIAAAAKAAIEQGHEIFCWHVRDHNRRGRAFYAAIGGQEQTHLPVALEGEALVALAAEA